MRKCAAFVVIVWALSVGVVSGQEPEAGRAGWTPGPTVGKLGDRATIQVPEGHYFLDRTATRRFLEENQNIPDGDELGTVVRVNSTTGDSWFAVFSYGDTGYIKDDEKDSIDAAALMRNMQKGAQQGNEARAKRGWSALNLEGWHQPPYYDTATNNLTWATKLSSDGEPIVNHSVRLLGRSGLMSAQLVGDPATIDTATAEFNTMLASYAFNTGSRYAEFRPGDKIAAYGLTALIAGGAGAAAVKTGLFKKFGKLLVLLFVGIAAGIKKLFNALRGEVRTERPIPVVPGTTRPS